MAHRTVGHPLTRREFNQASVSALFVGMTVLVSSCGGGSSSGYSSSPSAPTGGSSGGTSSGSSDKTASISANHGHVATVTSAQLQAGGAVTLHIQGTASHDHTVDLAQGDVKNIAAGARVSKDSSADASHMHVVTFN